MCRAYLRSDEFYSFWFQPLSRQHPAFEMYVCGILFVCLFIVFACESVWNVLVNQKGFLYITQRFSENSIPFLLNDLSLASKYTSVSDISFFIGAKSLSLEHSLEFCKQPVVAGDHIWRIGWVGSNSKCNSCSFAIVAIDLWYGALSWWKNTFFFFICSRFFRMLPSNSPII